MSVRKTRERSCRYQITHRTGYVYEGEVLQSYNLARLTPANNDRQLLVDHSISITPGCATFAYIDYWGTRIHAFDVHVPHRRLEVTARSTVETDGDLPTTPEPIDRKTLDDSALRDQLCELLAPSDMTQPDDAITTLAAQLSAGQSPAQTVGAIVDWVHTELRYERGVTNVETPATGVLATRRGVCQDFAHLTIALLRSAGIPARYVSGYVHGGDPTDVGASVAGESHAWVDAWIGNWQSVDPTHDESVAGRYIRVAHGRDYTDVAPLAGIYTGAPSKALQVTVEITRVA
jgi:transglutaminase-like putative cysteine protease